MFIRSQNPRRATRRKTPDEGRFQPREQPMKIEFQVQGSASEPYNVVFEKHGDALLAYCTCPAGEFGTYCKHRFQILNGSKKGIVSSNESQVQEVVGWFKGSRLEEVMLVIEEKERVIALLKKEVQELKQEVSELMKTG